MYPHKEMEHAESGNYINKYVDFSCNLKPIKWNFLFKIKKIIALVQILRGKKYYLR